MLWYAQQQFGDFSLKLQFRDVAPGTGRANSGVFTRFPDPRIPLDQRPPGSCGTVGSARTSPAWVAIYCGQEVQIYDGDTGEPQKTGSIYNFDVVPLADAGVTPKNQWTSRAGDPPTDLRQFASGFIGLQNHSDNDLIEFRDIRVRAL
jgi:hypothetical protein